MVAYRGLIFGIFRCCKCFSLAVEMDGLGTGVTGYRPLFS